MKTRETKGSRAPYPMLVKLETSELEYSTYFSSVSECLEIFMFPNLKTRFLFLSFVDTRVYYVCSLLSQLYRLAGFNAKYVRRSLEATTERCYCINQLTSIFFLSTSFDIVDCYVRYSRIQFLRSIRFVQR